MAMATYVRQENPLVQYILELFRKPSAEVMAQRELEDAKRMLLEAQRSKDYYTKMVEFYDTRIRSLNMSIKKANEV